MKFTDRELREFGQTKVGQLKKWK